MSKIIKLDINRSNIIPGGRQERRKRKTVDICRDNVLHPKEDYVTSSRTYSPSDDKKDNVNVKQKKGIYF
jgi:hypothetical protein